MATQAKLIARWSTRGARYWLELYENVDGSYSYSHESGGGYMGRLSLDDAMRRMAQELDCYRDDGHTLVARAFQIID